MIGNHGLLILRSFCILYLSVFTPIAFPLTVQPRSFDELVQRADTIVVATVTGLRGAWGADKQTIYTFVMLTDLDVLKGDVPAANFELRIPGGVVGDRAQLYPGMPIIQQGQRYVLFIRGQQRDFFPLVGVYQGLYRVFSDEHNQQRVIRADQHPGEITSGVKVEMPTLNDFTTRIRTQLSSHQREAQ